MRGGAQEVTFPDDKILMVNSSGQTIAKPGPLDHDGDRFKDIG
jgi:hypothetical protein